MQSKYATLRAKARKLAEDAGLVIKAAISSGDEFDSIPAAAKHNHSDLLVIGMPKHTWITSLARHKVAESVPCALLVQGTPLLRPLANSMASLAHLHFQSDPFP